MLETGRTSYVLGINEQNSLQNVYWGKKLLRDDDLAPAHTAPEHASFDSRETMTNEDYPGWGGIRYNEPCVKVTLARPGQFLGGKVIGSAGRLADAPA